MRSWVASRRAGAAWTPTRGLGRHGPEMSSRGWEHGNGEKNLMLVLSRQLQQQICIDERITLTILKTRGKTVRIGIEAPREVRVRRGELAPATGCSRVPAVHLSCGQRPGAASPALERGQHAAPCSLGRRPPLRSSRRPRPPALDPLLHRPPGPEGAATDRAGGGGRRLREAAGIRCRSDWTDLLQVLQQDALHLQDRPRMAMDVHVVRIRRSVHSRHPPDGHWPAAPRHRFLRRLSTRRPLRQSGRPRCGSEPKAPRPTAAWPAERASPETGHRCSSGCAANPAADGRRSVWASCSVIRNTDSGN